MSKAIEKQCLEAVAKYKSGSSKIKKVALIFDGRQWCMIISGNLIIKS